LRVNGTATVGGDFSVTGGTTLNNTTILVREINLLPLAGD